MGPAQRAPTKGYLEISGIFEMTGAPTPVIDFDVSHEEMGRTRYVPVFLGAHNRTQYNLESPAATL